MNANSKKRGVSAAVAIASLVVAQVASAAPVLPGYLTDPTAVKGALDKDTSYMPPERLKYPYISTYYVRPTVKVGTDVKIGIFVTDFESSKIRFLDDSHVFTAYLEYGPQGGARKIVSLKNLKSGDATFTLKDLAAGAYEMRVWAVDQKGRESHRVIHDFRVVAADFAEIPADKVYAMTTSDLAKYGIRNDGDVEKIVYVDASGKSKVVKEKRSGVPGYTVTVPLDPKTGDVPVKAYEKAKVVYDPAYNKAAVEQTAVANADGIQRFLDDKAAAGFRKIVMLPGTYRISYTKSIFVPSGITLDLGKAVLKQNGFTGASSCIVRMRDAVDTKLIGGTIEGDYWTHNYQGSPNNSEWPAGFELSGDCRYCTVDGVKVVDITGYGGQHGISNGARGGVHYFLQYVNVFEAGGLDPKTGKVDVTDKYRFTSEFKDLKKVRESGHDRLQISKYLGYQGIGTRSWQMTVAWYDAAKQFISSETSFQYREMWVPGNAAFLRVSVEAESVQSAKDAALTMTAFRMPINCSVVRSTFDHCRCVGYAASAMRNMLFAANLFTHCGESAARCAFDAEDGGDQMQDCYFLKNVFKENPFNNSILTCGGHNMILEKNEGSIYFWGRTYSPVVKNSVVDDATYRCDSRLRSGYGRFEGNTYRKALHLGLNDMKSRPDNWDYVISGLTFEGEKDSYDLDIGVAGRAVNCTFRNMPVRIANAFACAFENCTDGSTYLPFPNGRWSNCKVRDCKFNRFYCPVTWDKSQFENTTFNKFWNSTVTAKDCSFTNCKFTGIDGASLDMTKCTFVGTNLHDGYMSNPVTLAFRGCSVTTPDDAPFASLGLHAIGKVGFGGCTFTGRKGAFEINSLVPHKPIAPAKSSDSLKGEIVVKGIDWKSDAKQVITRAQGAVNSTKQLIISGTNNKLSEGVALVSELPSRWILR